MQVLSETGYSNRKIAIELGQSFDTVRKEVMNIMNKTGMSTRHEVAFWYLAKQTEINHDLR